MNIRHGLLVALSYVSESPASERPAHHASRVGFSAMMVRVHLTSLHLKGSTKTPLRGDKERPVRLRTTGGLAAARTGDPQSIRGTRALEAPGLPRHTTPNADGRDGPWLRVRTLTRTRRLRVLACNTHNAGAGPRHEASPRIQNARAVRPVCVWCGGGGASTSARRTGIAAEAIMLRRSDSGGVRAR